jgi:hypothetical protein
MITSQKNLIHFPPNSVAGCISNVECSVGGNLELRQTLVSLTLRGWRHIQNLCGFSTPTAMGQSFIMTLHKLPSSSHEKTSVKILNSSLLNHLIPYLYSEKIFDRKRIGRLNLL